MFTRAEPWQNQRYRITIKLPSFGAVFLCHKYNADDSSAKAYLGPDDVDIKQINKDIRIFINKNKNFG